MNPTPAAGPDAGVTQRFHALDGLRGLIFLLVVLFHSLLGYTVTPLATYPFKDRMTSFVADITAGLLDVFMMPIFFILAGFFAALLYLQRGALAFLRNRAARIGFPLAAGWLILVPLVGAGFAFANVARRFSTEAGFVAVQRAVTRGNIFFPDKLDHLWFLYYLLLFYAAALVVAPLVIRAPARARQAMLDAFATLLEHPWLRLPVLALISFLILRAAGGTLSASPSFVPDGWQFVGYGFYLAFGWLLYLKRERITCFDRFAWTHINLALAMFFIAGPALAALTGTIYAPSSVSWGLARATAVWLLFFGLTGLFLRHLNRPAAAVRYIVDSSFWIYLLHMPLVIWLQGFLTGLDAPAGIKILLVVGTTYLLGFATYDLFVRSTALGAALNGKRHPRAIFRRGSAQSVPAQ